jgi:hypothetical protein
MADKLSPEEEMLGEMPEEERAEYEIRQQDDAEEVRIVPLSGELAPFGYVTVRIIRSKSLGKQVRKTPAYTSIGDGSRGYQRRGETVTVETYDENLDNVGKRVNIVDG